MKCMHDGRTCEEQDVEYERVTNDSMRLRRRINEINALVDVGPGRWWDEDLTHVIGKLREAVDRSQDSVPIHQGSIRLLAKALKYWSSQYSHTEDQTLLNEAAFILSQLQAEPEPPAPSVVMRIDDERFDITPGQQDAIKRLLNGWEKDEGLGDDYHPYPL